MRPNMTKKTSIAAVAIVAALALPVVAGAENKLKVQDGTGTDVVVISDLGRIGIGLGNNVEPGGPIFAKGVASTPTLAGSFFEYQASGSTPNANTAPNFTLLRTNDAGVNNGWPRANDSIGHFAFGSRVSGAVKYAAHIFAKAESDWTSTAYKTYLSFNTTTASASGEKMRITSVGNVGVGTIAPAQKLEVNGGVRMNTAVVRPVCSAAVRGTLWFEQKNTAGVADTMAVCAKGADESYAWRNLIQ